MEEEDEWLPGKKGTRAERGHEPHFVPKNNHPAMRARYREACTPPVQCSRLHGKAWPSLLGPIRPQRQHPRGAAPPNLHSRRMIAHPTMLQSTFNPPAAHMKLNAGTIMVTWEHHETPLREELRDPLGMTWQRCSHCEPRISQSTSQRSSARGCHSHPREEREV